MINARVELGEGVYVGTNASILPDLTVGSWATIGANSAVIQDVPPGATVMGVPAQLLIPGSANDTSTLTAGSNTRAMNPCNPLHEPGAQSGKSTFMSDLLVPMFGEWAIAGDRSTEAGLRQAIGHDAAPVAIDEFDKYRQRQQVLELFRSSSRVIPCLCALARAVLYS